VLLNLLQNALQATPPGGRLRLATRQIEPPSAPKPNAPPELWFEVEVADTGVGIAQEELDEIFSPFYTTKTYGTGLGLAISQKIIQDHGGRLDVSSTPGEGTSFRIQLPQQIPDAEGKTDEDDPDR
jgi:signal transduction histidine kinase